MPTTILNFAHPLTPAHLDQIRNLREGLEIERVIDLPAHFTEETSYQEQVVRLVKQTDLTSNEWQTLPLLVNPPGFAPIAANLLAYIHGLRGEFPDLLRVARDPERSGMYVVADIIELQSVRDSGRIARVKGA